jgi:hypothetical protein
VIRKNNKSLNPQTFSNTPSDRTRLVNKLSKLSGITVCLEATGVYQIEFGFIAYVCVIALLAGVLSSPQPTRLDKKMLLL